ncbi:MAG TPA: tryptophan-rich sensory protein [Flavilitoribacter sp.]|nr:tryptophan-rich sensory protein [Flavilitoribacter sp.]HMQ91075.1 tryptophan-rich sensory protein [Flavilitoribacter sp.]
MIFRIIIFLILNFSALAIGGLFTNAGVTSDWYGSLDKAPWTPPGWVFGFAWTTIMICFSIYLAYLWPKAENRKVLIGLYALQLILNIGWNPAFFHYQYVSAALVIIVALTLLIAFMLFFYRAELMFKSALLLPYLIWLLIATSLNGYILLKN